MQTLYEAVELIVVTATGVTSLVVVDLVVISVLIVVFNIADAFSCDDVVVAIAVVLFTSCVGVVVIGRLLVTSFVLVVVGFEFGVEEVEEEVEDRLSTVVSLVVSLFFSLNFFGASFCSLKTNLSILPNRFLKENLGFSVVVAADVVV